MAAIEKKFKSKTENLKEIRKFVEEFLVSNKVSENDREKIILAIDEACTNKIKHAYNYNTSKDILVYLEIKNQIFTAEISDWGKKFEPNKIPLPDLQENFRNQKKGGYGIFLIKKIMDNVEYKFLKDGENKIILTKNITVLNNG